MRREGKAGPFIPSEVRAHTGPARATTPTVVHRCRRATTAAGAQAKVSPLERRRVRLGGNVCARATTGAARKGCFFTNIPNFSARATTFTPERQRLRPGDTACVWATTSVPVRRRVLRGRGVFSQTPQTLALGRRRLRPGDNACVWATMSALAQRRLDPGFQMFAFFRALAIQTKLFHYLFFKITGTVLKMVIQSYFY